ncbi:hypothetical protein OIU78_025195 [Salix suchowensis]|nr:hypothetical protein OIU78_025195 [Salix suchowensis]
MFLCVTMLTRLLWMIDHGCIVVLKMVILILNILRVLEDLSIFHFQLIKAY